MLEEGKTYPVTCQVGSVVSMRNLIVTLHLRDQVLHTKNIQGEPSVGATNIMAIFNMMAQQRYHATRHWTCSPTVLSLRLPTPWPASACVPSSGLSWGALPGTLGTLELLAWGLARQVAFSGLQAGPWA